MKKIISIFAVSTLILTACGEETAETDSATDTEETEVVEEEGTTDTEEEVDTNTESEEDSETDSTSEDEELEQQVGDVIEADGGSRTVVGQVENIDETQSSGPFDVTLKHAQLSQFQPAEDMVEMFGGEDLVLVTFDIEVTNNSEDMNTIHPGQGIAVTDTGNQIDANLLLSDDVGGDFHGEVTKSGNVFFIYDGNADEVSNVRYIINSGHNEDFENFDEDIEFTVDF